jgi:hypothetical protein
MRRTALDRTRAWVMQVACPGGRGGFATGSMLVHGPRCGRPRICALLRTACGKEDVAKAASISSQIEKVLSVLLFTQQRKLIMIDELFWVCRTLIADLARLGSFR